MNNRIQSRPLVRVKGVTKSFGGRGVLGPIDLDFHAGEFLALLGPNGAGKSTLIKILDGVYAADSGAVIAGESADGLSPVAVVHQDLGIADELTVFENIWLGRTPLRRRFGMLNRPAERRIAQQELERFGLHVQLDQPAGELAPGNRALLAVARAAAAKPLLIILDETTSVLSNREATRLIETLRSHCPPDVAFVMVTHKLAEALALANRLVILRDGQVVLDQRTPLPNIEDVTSILAPVMGHAGGAEPRPLGTFDRDVLVAFENVFLGNVGPLNFKLRRGEAVTVTGRLGEALTSVAYLASGVVQPDKGRVRFQAGISTAIVSPSREQSGSIGPLTVGENLILASLPKRRRPLIGLLDRSREASDVRTTITSLDIRPDRSQAPMATLSGGNQQKVLFGRALLTGADVVVLGEPTRGVDVGTRQQIYQLMRDLKRTGHAVLVVASDPHDALAASDRLFVLGDSGLSQEWRTSELTTERIVELV